MFKIKKLSPFPPNSNPFCYDAYLMGTTIGSNVTVMMGCHESERCNYLIVVNTETGERLRIEFTDDKKAFAADTLCQRLVDAREGITTDESEEILVIEDEIL